MDSSGAWQLKARVAAPPAQGKANDSLVALLAHELRVPKSAVAIASGNSARVKTVEIAGDAVTLATRLEALGGAK